MDDQTCWAPAGIKTRKVSEADDLRRDIQEFLDAGGEIEMVGHGISGNDNRSHDSAEYQRMASKHKKKGKPSDKARKHIKNLFTGSDKPGAQC